VEGDIPKVSGVLIALVGILGTILGAVVGTVGGYLAGVAQSRNERRDNALAEIYKEMTLFYGRLLSWTAEPLPPDPDQPSAESSGAPVKDYVEEQYKKFHRNFYSNAIWLGKGTYDLIEEFVQASGGFLDELNRMTGRVGRLPDGTNPTVRREERITPKFKEVRDALQAEVEASRTDITFPYRIVIRKNRAGQRRTGPGEGE
jgi:hypothetical protein